MHKYAALNAIRQHNEQNETRVSYEEIRDLNSDFVFSGAGEWAAYTDNLTGILLGEHDDPDDAFLYASDDVLWIVVLMPADDVVIVYRSPYRELREVNEKAFMAMGLERGPDVSYTLPPDIEGSIRQDLDPEMPPTVTITSTYMGIDPLHENPNDLTIGGLLC